MQPKGVAKAYRRSQSLIYNTEATTVFLEDEGRTLEVPIPLLNRLNSQNIPYAHCAWCAAQQSSWSTRESLSLTPQRSVASILLFSSISLSDGMVLQLRQFNFGSHSTDYAHLREDTTYDRDHWSILCHQEGR